MWSDNNFRYKEHTKVILNGRGVRMRYLHTSSESIVWSVQILAQLIVPVCCNPIYFFNNIVKQARHLESNPWICMCTELCQQTLL